MISPQNEIIKKELKDIKKQIGEVNNAQNKRITNLEDDVKKKIEEYLALIEKSANTVSGTGEDVTLSGTVDSRFKKFEVGGNDYQFTQEQGKNIAKINETDWELTKDNTIKNKDKNHGAVLTEFNLKAGQKVTIKFKPIQNPTASTMFSCAVNGTTDNSLSFFNIQDYNLNQIYSKEYTAIEDCTIKCTMWNNNNSDIFEFQFWASIEEMQEYEPFKPAMPSPEYPSEIKAVGDNGSANIKVNNGNVAKINETNWELTEQNTIKNTFSKANGQYLANINLKKGQTAHVYLKLITKPTPVSLSFYVDGTVNNDCSFSNIQTFNLNQVYHRTHTAKEDCIISHRVWGNEDNASIEFQFWASIDEELAEYIPHKEQDMSVPVQQPMLKGDYFDLDRGKEVHNWKKVDLSSVTTNQFYKNPPTDDRPRWGTQYFKDAIPNSKLLCTHLKQVDGQETWDKIEGIAISPTTSTVYLYIDGVYDYTSLREALDKMTLYYQSKTPSELDLTEDQKKALQQLSEAKTYEGTTHIFSEDEVPPIFDVEAYAKITNTSGQTNEIQSEPTSEPPTYEEPSMEENEVEEVE